MSSLQVKPIDANAVSRTANQEPVISLRRLWKVYEMGNVRVEALRGVSLNLNRGEFVAIMGASGSGKSTLLNLLGCLDRPTKGIYYLDGTDVSTFSAAERADIRNQKIGFIFQNFNLLPRTSVWENIETPMFYAGLSREERTRRVREALKVVGIPEKATALTNQLSGGQQQRVAIARALVNNPAIVLADEPTGNLDSTNSDEILCFLKDLNQEDRLTLIMVTHDQEAAAFASRRIVMRDGRIVGDSYAHATSFTQKTILNA
jgi:putative ABC transport system ATP-binding protein